MNQVKPAFFATTSILLVCLAVVLSCQSLQPKPLATHAERASAQPTAELAAKASTDPATEAATGSVGDSDLNTIDALSDAANALTAIVDSSDRTLLGCAISPSEASEMLNKLHAKLDQAIASARERALKKNRSSELEQKLRDCNETCRCGTYSDWLEAGGESESEIGRLVMAKATRLTSAERIQCAKKSLWLCGSELLRELRRD
jgi:hypothetical protein